MANKTQVTIAKMQKDIEFIKKEMSELKESFEGFVKCADKRYAAKIVEKIVYGAVTVILIAVLGGVLLLIGLRPLS